VNLLNYSLDFTKLPPLTKVLMAMPLQLKVPKLACSSCAKKVMKALKTIDADATVKVDTKTKLVDVETQASETAVKEALTAAGYPSA
jgi:copper chaperone